MRRLVVPENKYTKDGKRIIYKKPEDVDRSYYQNGMTQKCSKLLIDEDWNKLGEEIHKYDIVKDLSVTTITMNGIIEGIEFNDDDDEFVQLCNRIIEDKTNDKITKFESKNIGKLANSVNTSKAIQIESSLTKESVSNKGRKKRIVKKLPTSSDMFISQINVQIISVKYADHRMYNFKLFRSGSFCVPGVCDLEDGIAVLKYFVNKLNEHSNANRTLRLKSCYLSMINFKSVIPMQPNELISLSEFGKLLNQLPSDNPFKQLIANDVFHTHSYASVKNSNCASIKLRHTSPPTNIAIIKDIIGDDGVEVTTDKKTSETYLFEIYASGKISIKGIYDVSEMIRNLVTLNDIIRDNYNTIILKNAKLIDETMIKNMKMYSTAFPHLVMTNRYIVTQLQSFAVAKTRSAQEFIVADNYLLYPDVKTEVESIPNDKLII